MRGRAEGLVGAVGAEQDQGGRDDRAGDGEHGIVGVGALGGRARTGDARPRESIAGQHVHRDVLGQAPHGQRLPRTVGGVGDRERLEARLRVVEDRQQEPAPTPCHVLDGGGRGGREQDRRLGEPAGVGVDRGPRDHEHRAARVGPPRGAEVGPGAQQQPVAAGVHPAVLGNGQPERGVDRGVGAEGPGPLLGGVEVGRPAGGDAPGDRVVGGAHGDVVRPAGEELGGVHRIGAPAPQADHAGVPGLGRVGAVGIQGGGQQDRVAVDPGHRALGLRQPESPLGPGDEAPGGQVELADLHGVRAPTGQPDQHAVVRRAPDNGARVDPVHVLLGGEGVHVQERLPGRVVHGGGALCEHRPRHPAPQPAGMLGVPPQGVGVAAPQDGPGDAVRGVEDLQGAGGRGVGGRPGREVRHRPVAALADP